MKKIGILLIATGKYDVYINPLVESINQYFMKSHDVTIFIFSDKDVITDSNMVLIPIVHENWPFITLKRYHVFDNNQDKLSHMDYLYYCDVDMLFVSEVGDEILPISESGLVAVEHPGFYGGRRGSYESRNISTAYISPTEGGCYYAGGFNGGTTEAFLNMSKIIKERVDIDLTNDIIAIWHDESQMNRYMVDNTPSILNPSYCYPESWDIPFEKKLLALDKNHKEIRK